MKRYRFCKERLLFELMNKLQWTRECHCSYCVCLWWIMLQEDCTSIRRWLHCHLTFTKWVLVCLGAFQLVSVLGGGGILKLTPKSVWQPKQNKTMSVSNIGAHSQYLRLTSFCLRGQNLAYNCVFFNELCRTKNPAPKYCVCVAVGWGTGVKILPPSQH